MRRKKRQRIVRIIRHDADGRRACRSEDQNGGDQSKAMGLHSFLGLVSVEIVTKCGVNSNIFVREPPADAIRWPPVSPMLGTQAHSWTGKPSLSTMAIRGERTRVHYGDRR